MLRILTAGESHGKSLVGILEGFPANVRIDMEKINHDLWRRQQGYGRGGRMQIETDRIEILSGIRGGYTLGSPIAFLIMNKDYKNWQPYMDPQTIDKESRRVSHPRPGHADLAGAVKYNFTDIRNVLERSSARETAVRVAAGSIARQLLSHFGIIAYSHVTSIGEARLERQVTDPNQLISADQSPVRCVDKQAEQQMIDQIDLAKKEGDSLGGTIEVQISGVPVGLGNYTQWDHKLDAKLAYALMSIQAIKGVEIGHGFANAGKRGSQVHDEIFHDPKQGYYRKTNNAGGIEGGISNGETIVARCAMKPIPTLYKPLQTVDIDTLQPHLASVERSDACAVPAASVVAELVATTVIANEFLTKFSGDSLEEIIEKWKK